MAENGKILQTPVNTERNLAKTEKTERIRTLTGINKNSDEDK